MDDLEWLYTIREVNTLHGFQFSSDEFKLCYILDSYASRQSSITNFIKNNTNSKTIEFCHHIGYDYISIHETEKKLIPQVLNCLFSQLQNNEYITLITKLKPRYYKNDKFSLEISENKTIDYFNKSYHSWKMTFIKLLASRTAIWQEDRWKTQRGKEFCKWLNDKRPNDLEVDLKPFGDFCEDGFALKLVKKYGQDYLLDFPFIYF